MTDLSALPPVLNLRAGGRVLVPLPSYSGSGNVWSVRCLHGPRVADAQVHLGTSTDEGYAVPEAPVPIEPPDAAPVSETLVVTGLGEGDAVWQLVLARPFAPTSPTATHELQVIVRG